MLTLTVAFPTYNRSAAIASRLSEYLAIEAPAGVELLISDNFSSDDSLENLRQLTARTSSKNPVRLVGNEQNLGYHGNFVSVIEKSMTDYVLVMSDEDRLDYAKLPRLMEFLAKETPAMASPQAIVNERLYRGKPTSIAIDETELRGSVNYVAGTIYHRGKSVKHLPLVKDLFKTNVMATLYPQVLLTDRLFCSYPCWFYGDILVTKAENLPTHIVDNITSNGGKYYHLASRWEQLKSELAFLKQLRFSRDASIDTDKVDRLMRVTQSKAFHVTRFGIEKEQPDLLDPFLEGARSITARQLSEMSQRIAHLEEERDALKAALAAFVERTGILERRGRGGVGDGGAPDPDTAAPH